MDAPIIQHPGFTGYSIIGIGDPAEDVAPLVLEQHEEHTAELAAYDPSAPGSARLLGLYPITAETPQDAEEALLGIARGIWDTVATDWADAHQDQPESARTWLQGLTCSCCGTDFTPDTR